MKKKLKILLTTILFGLMTQAWAQTTLQVATRHFEKDFEQIKALKLDAEKADIEIIVWNKSKVSLSADLSAKHPEKNTAAHDLNFLKLAIDVKNGVLHTRNYILLSQKDQKPESNFKTKYVIRIPAGLEMELKNSFGKINISGETKKLTLNSEFCINSLSKISGNTKIQTKYGEVKIDEIEGTTNIKTERTNLSLRAFSGNISIVSFYGEILLNGPKEVQILTLNADKSEIKLIAIPIKKLALNLSTIFGQIITPTEMGKLKMTKKTAQLIFNSNEKSSMNITNKSGNITLEKL